MKEFFGYGRTRSGCDKGDIVKRHFNDYVNCIHTMVGGGWKTMEILVAEFDMSEIKYIGQMSSSQNSRVIDPEGISYAVTNGHKDGEPKIIERDTPMKGNYTEPRICMMVGRDPNNPKSRKKADGYVQMLEIGDDVSNTLTSVQKDNLVAEPNRDTARCIQVGNIYHDLEKMPNRSGGRVYSKEGCSPTILSRDFKSPKLVADTLRIPQATKQGYVEVQPGGLFDMSYPESKTRRGCVQEGGTVSPTLMASGEGSCLYEGKVEQSYRIRKLTPKECFRLMGVSETDIDKIQQSGVSRNNTRWQGTASWLMCLNIFSGSCLSIPVKNRNSCYCFKILWI